MASLTELAQDALAQLELLRNQLDAFRQSFDRLDLIQLRERVRVIEERVSKLGKSAEEMDELRKLVAVLEDRENELKNVKEESDKRQWQLVYIFAGAMASLLVTVIVQLVLAFVKKP